MSSHSGICSHLVICSMWSTSLTVFDGGSHIYAKKAIIFNPCVPRKLGSALPFYTGSQRKDSFVVVTPRPYHDEFKLVYNVPSAVNYLDSSCKTMQDL